VIYFINYSHKIKYLI